MSNSSSKLRCLSSRSTLRSVSGVSSAIAIFSSSIANSLGRSNAVEHLASEEHWKRVKGFLWKYGGGIDRVDLFRIVEADYAK
ncbi:hypothetical protein C2S52_006452, partial [Perilla frutescens var. hirtella]